MRILCDTQIILWLMLSDPRLKPSIVARLSDRTNVVLFSQVSLFEIAIKIRIGKFDTSVDAVNDSCLVAGMTLLDIKHPHLVALSRLGRAMHNDPFDHLLIAQAQVEGVPLLTADRIVQRYPIDVIKA